MFQHMDLVLGSLDHLVQFLHWSSIPAKKVAGFSSEVHYKTETVNEPDFLNSNKVDIPI